MLIYLGVGLVLFVAGVVVGPKITTLFKSEETKIVSEVKTEVSKL